MTAENLRFKAEVIKVVGHPERLMILNLLLSGEICVKDICQKLNLPQPKVSQHIGIMKEIGIITFRKEGTRTLYRISSELVRSIVPIIFNSKT